MRRTRAPTAEFIEESENSRLGNSPTIPFVLLFWFITLSLLQQAGSGAGGDFDKKKTGTDRLIFCKESNHNFKSTLPALADVIIQ